MPFALTVQQVAERLQAKEEHIRVLLRRGDLKGFKVGDLWRIKEVDLDDYIKRQGRCYGKQ